MNIVIKHFFDLQDNLHEYHEGDTYPREGHKVTDARIAELAGARNNLGEPLIEVKQTPRKPKKAEAE